MPYAMPNVDQRLFDKPAYATATVAAGAANVTEITVTLRNANGAPVAGVFFLYLSDSAAGIGYSATTASGAFTVKTAGTTGTLIGTELAKFGIHVMTLANGTFVASLTDTAKTAFVVCVIVDGTIIPVATLATASYG